MYSYGLSASIIMSVLESKLKIMDDTIRILFGRERSSCQSLPPKKWKTLIP